MTLNDSNFSVTSDSKPVRVYVDGCFDLVHFGHANALRQARQLGQHLIVGVHSDEEIRRNKGDPVFSQEERYKLIRAIKWVDEVIEDAPYVATVEFLNKHMCDFCAHGEDISITADGQDAYQAVKDAGRYRQFKRTEGVSTTDLVARMLRQIKKVYTSGATAEQGSGLPTDCHLRRTRSFEMLPCLTSSSNGSKIPEISTVLNKTDFNTTPSGSPDPTSPFLHSWSTGDTPYMANALRISQFNMGTSPCDNLRDPRPGDVVVFVPGAFDLFHLGHLCFLEKCLELGNYILVGLYSDQTTSFESGRMGPIMRLHERLLSLLACRHVNNVIIGAPYVVPKNLLLHFKVNFVVVGKDTKLLPTSEGLDPMAVPKQLGLFRRVDSYCSITTSQVILRIMRNRLMYEERNRKKERKEAELIRELGQGDVGCSETLPSGQFT